MISSWLAKGLVLQKVRDVWEPSNVINPCTALLYLIPFPFSLEKIFLSLLCPALLYSTQPAFHRYGFLIILHSSKPSARGYRISYHHTFKAWRPVFPRLQTLILSVVSWFYVQMNTYIYKHTNLHITVYEYVVLVHLVVGHCSLDWNCSAMFLYIFIKCLK